MTATQNSALIFYSLNIALLLAGIYLWLTYSIMRVVIVYSIFNIILFSLITRNDAYAARSRGIASSNMFQFLSVTLVVLLVGTVVATYQSLYVRPSFVMVAMGAAMVLFVIILLVFCGQSEFKQSFALFAGISVVLLVAFGSYLAQPNLANSPAYATVDAYRDYANTVRIVSLSRIDPAMMILTQYYHAFPVMPLIIANISLIAGLPVNISHLILATVANGVAVMSLFLLSKRIAGTHARNCPGLPFLPVLLVCLQPVMMDSAWLVAPLRVSIAIVTMIIYLVYTRILGSAPTHSVTVTVIILIIIVVPLHGASAMFVILLLGMLALPPWRARRSLAMLGILAMTVFLLYLFFSAGGPYASVLGLSRDVWSMLQESLGLSTGFVNELASRVLVHGSSSETGSFLLSTVPALLLSVFTILVVRLAGGGRKVVADAKHRFLYIMLGVLLLVGFGMSLVGPSWKIDARQITFPLTPVAVMAAAMVIPWVLGDMSVRRKTLVGGLLSLCILSMLTSPLYLESNPDYVRTMPIESERDASMFVSTKFDARASDVTQIVSDWPYYNDVEASLYSFHIGIEGRVKVPNLMYEPIATCQETMMLSRTYFMQSDYLQTVSPYVKILSDNSTRSHLNKIYDTYSVSIYVGLLSC